MKFSQSSAVYFNYSLQYAIKDLSRLGYDGIEVWGGRPHMYRGDLDAELPQIKSLLKEYNLEICNFIPAQFRYPSILCSQNETVRTDSVEYICQAIDNAVSIGSPSVSLCPNMALFDHDLNRAWQQLFKSYAEIGEYNQDKGLKLLIEPAHKYETNLIRTVEECIRMIEKLRCDNFGVLIDTGHCQINGEDFKTVIELCEDLPLHIHIDDNHGEFDDHLIPGAGVIDFPYFAEALSQIDYKGYLSVELGTKYIMDPTTACKQSLVALKKIWD